jgi:hypothetical protein
MSLPPFPNIELLNWEPQPTSTPAEIGRIPGPFMIHADADNAGYADDVRDAASDSGSPRLNNWWDGCEPQGPREIVVLHYWKLVPGTFTHLSGLTELRKSWEYQHGVSTTDAQSITATMNIGGEGLSSSLSASLSHSVTISDQQTQTTEFTVAAPGEGKVRVWMLWDLFYEFRLINKSTGLAIPSGTYRGDVDFSNDDHYSGAYLNYRFSHLPISSGTLCSQDKVFNA